jgi:hypothetical protein
MTVLDSRPEADVRRHDDLYVPDLQPEPARRAPRRGRALLEAFVVIGIVAVLVAGVLVIGHAVSTSNAAPSAPLVSPGDIDSAAAQAHGTVQDRGFSKLENGVQHNHAWEQPVSKADRKLLSHQLIVARATALQYPTLASAEAAGLDRAGPFSPGLGTHLIAPGNYAYSAGTGIMSDDQIRHPIAWIYDGTKPNSPIAGLFYQASVENPGGFAGPNDVWHKHKNICIVRSKDGGIDTPLGADRDATQAQCDAVGGSLLAATGPLLHAWVVPGYEDSQGVFAHLSPGVMCNDGTYNTIDITKVGTRKTICVDGTE